MAVLENIRKRTTVLILIIGLALFAFVISGVFTSSNFGGDKVGSSVAEINGEDISIDEFRQEVEVASNRIGPTASNMQVVNQVWENKIRKTILGEQFEDLGIGIEQDQIVDFLRTTGYAQNPQFQDQNGQFDANMFKQTVADWKVNNPAQYEAWLQTEAEIVQLAKEQTYFNMVKAGVGATLKEGELDYKLANEKMDIKYVRVPYTSIPDSTITVTKSEIADYVSKHKEEYKQDPARDLQYVFFQEKPSEADEAAIKEEITKLLDDTIEYNSQTDRNDTIRGFRNTKDVAAFLDRYSDTKFDTIFKAKKNLPSSVADTLMSLNIGQIYGPYKDGDSYKISKMIARKPNGSVKASHILLAYEGATRANPEVKRTKEEAEAKAKELLREAKKSGVVFSTLARDNSDGPSAPNGGDLGYFQRGVMVPAFNDFAFGNSEGSIGMVETDFGFHVIKIDDKEDVVQIATVSREIVASEETINTLFTNATKFEMETTDDESAFSTLAKEGNYVVRPVNKIKALDENLPGLPNQRNIVQWAFNGDTEVGDIKRFNINNGYAVVQLTGSYAEGVMSAEDASVLVLPKIRKERKAAKIIAANKGKDMSAIASDNGVSVSNASALTVKSPTIPGAGSEPVVVGTAYGMAEGATSGLIEGNTGIFKIEIVKKTEAPKLDNYSVYANALKTGAAARVNTAVYNALKEGAEIEDKRATFY
ncbi:peptidyl-prolyl cis-trans isomerase D [Maribacter dokdonensis]|uniref:Periplasmic chaperone PpiD n=1 Tax=Maribacter dokdonensis TaxID=320912 RepID=A0ABY0TZ73_9FLAO|nr:peptidylprolyl isomerase [Maribacter dokdonensis]KSA13345.1 Peptidyl-prolyl isomerase family protein [Maribacter dokdonensis DSW-8]SDR74882.1 peptidyl-prolyl cis-trans isomerase D [Maribacter dokdonensis]